MRQETLWTSTEGHERQTAFAGSCLVLMLCKQALTMTWSISWLVCPLAGLQGLECMFNNTRVGCTSAGSSPMANPFLPLEDVRPCRCC